MIHDHCYYYILLYTEPVHFAHNQFHSRPVAVTGPQASQSVIFNMLIGDPKPMTPPLFHIAVIRGFHEFPTLDIFRWSMIILSWVQPSSNRWKSPLCASRHPHRKSFSHWPWHFERGMRCGMARKLYSQSDWSVSSMISSQKVLLLVRIGDGSP
jgi:hypothetical protein